jgi:hypothetical protein
MGQQTCFAPLFFKWGLVNQQSPINISTFSHQLSNAAFENG